MPLYRFTCPIGHDYKFFSKILDRDQARQCPSCGAELQRQFEAPSIHTDIAPYQSPVTGQWVDSKAQRREDLRRNGCIEWEPGIRQDMTRRQEEAFEKSFAPVSQGIDEIGRQLISAGKLDPL